MSGDRYAPLRAGSCRVLGRKAAGTGWLLGPGWVLTCQHVVRGEEAGSLAVRFLWDERGEVPRAEGELAVSRVVEAAGGVDLALLELGEPAPARRSRLPLGEERLAAPFLAWGFRADVARAGRLEGGGLPAFGELVAEVADRGHRGFYLDSALFAPGMSGGPVVQGPPWRVVALAAVEIAGQGAAALPLAGIRGLFPEVAEVAGLAILPAIEEAQRAPPLRWLVGSRRPSAVFAGRGAELAELDRRLVAGSTAVTAVEGLGGIGKTELARQYVQRYADPLCYPGGVVWLDASRDLAGQWLELAPALEVAQADPAVMTREVLRRLSERSGLLVVLDNAESWAALQESLPYGPGLTVLATTRRHDLGGAQLGHLRLGVLPPEEAAALVRGVMGERAERHPEEVAALVAELAGHALALEVAAAYLRRRRTLPLEPFLARLRQGGLDLPEGVPYGRTFEAMMAEVVASLAPLPGAARLFRLTGFYGEAPAPVGLLRETWERLAEEADFDEAFAALCDLHLVEEVGEESWTVHRLVRAEARRVGDGNEAERQAHALALAARLNGLEEYDLAIFAGLEPHAEAIFAGGGRTEEEAGVLAEGARFLWRLGQLTRAERWARQALEVGLEALGPQDPEVAVRRSNLATILLDLGDLSGARREVEEALRIDVAALGPDHSKVAIDHSILALILKALGDLSGARRAVEEALRIDVAALGPDHPNVAVRRSNLATILSALGDLSGARREVEEALRIGVAALGPDHPNVAVRRSNLSLILKDLGDLSGARREVEEALRIDVAALGPDHPNVAVLRSNLATILQDLGDLSGARRAVEEALRIDVAALGPDHPDVAVRRSNLAFVLRELGDEPGSRAQAAEAVRIALRMPSGSQIRETVLRNWGSATEPPAA